VASSYTCALRISPSCQLDDTISEHGALELTGAADAIKFIAAHERDAKKTQSFNATLNISHVAHGDVKRCPQRAVTATVASTGVHSMSIALDGPVHNTLTGECLNIISSFLEPTKWLDFLLKGEKTCSGEGCILLAALDEDTTKHTGNDNEQDTPMMLAER
jgi:hypothetical protein